MIENKGIKIISNSIFVNPPDWLNISDSDRYIVLSKDTMKSEVDMFVFSLFVYNNVSFTDNPTGSLSNLINALNAEEVVLGGGVMFYEGDTKILPGCCCGLEQWQNIVNAIARKEDVWMGHDPFPIIEYKEECIVVWPDDCLGLYGNAILKRDLKHIEFSYVEMKRFIAQVKTDIEEFITKPFYGRIEEIDKYNSDAFISAIKQWFNIVL